jgi:uncharacterized tellurite resistance protein B-like protein
MKDTTMPRPVSGSGPDHQPPLADHIRSAAAQLQALPAAEMEILEALAFVLSRVADADQRITDDEVRRMELALADHARLSAPQAVLAVEIARHRKRVADVGRAYRESRSLRRALDAGQRTRLLELLFEVASADGEITDCEAAEILQVAVEMGFTRDHLARFRRHGLSC